MKHINLKFTKIKDHFNLSYNDLADELPKQGHGSEPITVNPKILLGALMIPVWDNIEPIDHDICKFAAYIKEAFIFDSFTYNKSLRLIFNHF